MRNLATPPPDPIPNGWADDSVSYHYKWQGIIKSTPQVRFTTPTVIWDTLLTLQYIDDRYPRCVSDTVWYHNFLHVKELDPTFIKSPLELAQLRELDDTMMVVYRELVQDSIETAVWTWGDNIVTVDSFQYAGYDLTDGYYTHGARRVRYNIDYTNGYPGEVSDSLVWPYGIYGQRQYQQPVKFYSRIFDVVGNIAPDTLILRNKFPSSTHTDQWYPYTNYHDTIHLRMRDTILYTQFRTIDTALMMLPVTHQFKKTSWEMFGWGSPRGPGAVATEMQSFIENTQRCQYNLATVITIGVIDTLHIYAANGKEDSIFCKKDPVYFVDSVRYFRYDDQYTNVPLGIYGTSRPDGYHGFYGTYGPIPPQCYYGWDTIDFWARDVQNPSDTLVNEVSTFSIYPPPFPNMPWLTSSMIEIRFFPGKWTNYELDMNAGTFTYLPVTSPDHKLRGHWDPVLRGGNVQVVIPTSMADSAYIIPYPGMVIFYPITGALGTPGIYVWGNSGGWAPSFAPVTIDSLNSVTDISKTPSPVKGRTLIYNKGKGAIKRTGMYYWSGQWNFIANSPYTSFPYYTHRMYWNFGDGSPIYQGVRPVHQYNASGKFRVSMISRDSIGHFDTCIAFVNISNVVAKPTSLYSLFGCKDTASFRDSSYTIDAGNITTRRWWFGDKVDTITPQSVSSNPVWYYTHHGKFKVKLVAISDRGCSDTGYVTIFTQGPRPAFKLLSAITGCKPYRIGLKNLADSFDMRNPNDTPTISTIFYWGDGQSSVVIGRHDTVWHTYTDVGTYHIYALGRDALPLNPINCPVVCYPDTVNGQAKIAILVNSSNLGKISGNANPHINDTAMYSVPNTPLATYTWSVQSGNIQSGAGTNAIIVKWPSTNGVYNVIAEKVNSSGCHDRDTLKVHVLMTSIKELSSVSEIKMYPNPANNDVTLSLNSQKNQDLNIKMYDVLGKVCLSDLIRSASGLVNKNYSLSEMSKGMYFVEISNGEEKTVFKLLIE